MGMLHAGTYRTPEEREANRVLFVERNGLKLAFLAFTYAVNGPRVPVELAVNHIDTARIAEDLALASAGGADFTLVLAHFGTEYATEPDSAQIRLVDFLFDRGADVVLGGHPHAVQRYELRTDTAGPKKGRQRLVIYSLGNFLSNQRRPGSDGGVAFFFTLSRAFDAAGSPVKSISSVGHESVWVSVRPEQGTRRFRLLPVRGYLDHYRPFDLPEADIARMREFRKEIEGRLGPGERGPWE
jgi:poly-gamma-glutamate synthesis protein (capsule biosynthesis protein)